MLTGAFGNNRNGTLMGEYSSLVGNAIMRKRMLSAEQAARIELELASRIKSEFISNMSHELRTPLNTVIGFSKLLIEHERRKLPDSEIVEYAHLIQDAATHLLAVINDILDMSKMQSGRYTLDAQEIPLEEVLKNVLASFQKQADEAGVSLNLKVHAPIPPVRGDDAKLAQIFSNLISNAIKFTRQGGHVEVEVTRMTDGGVQAVVNDTGIGMSAEELAIASLPFGQVDGSKTRWREGTGLGLPIAKALVSLHGGELHIRSEKSKGTEVTVRLPSRHNVSVADAREAAFGPGVI